MKIARIAAIILTIAVGGLLASCDNSQEIPTTSTSTSTSDTPTVPSTSISTTPSTITPPTTSDPAVAKAARIAAEQEATWVAAESSAAAQSAADQSAADQSAADQSPTADQLAGANGWYTPSGNWVSPETAARAIAAGITPGETVPDYLRCGTICGEGPTSGDLQSQYWATHQPEPTTHAAEPWKDCPAPQYWINGTCYPSPAAASAAGENVGD